MDLKFINVDPVTGKVSFALEAKKVSGIDKLVQIVIATLLTSPGSDYLLPTNGGGVPDLIGSAIDVNDISEVAADLSRRVTKTEQIILQAQIGLVISQEEKLLKFELLSVANGTNIDEVNMLVRVTNELGRTRDVVL